MIKTILPIGYCYGVSNTLNNIVKLAINNPNKDIVLYSAPVHNKNALNNLLKIKNISLLNKESEKTNVTNSFLVFSAHGHTKAQEIDAKQNGYQIYDSICPFLTFRNQNIIKDIDNYDKIYAIGDKTHPEVQAILSLKDNIELLNPNDEFNLKEENNLKVLVIYQSTINVDKFEIINKKLKRIFTNLTIISICPECANRFKKISTINYGENDVIIIIGDKSSANTTSLYEKAISVFNKDRVFFVLNVDELKKIPLPININDIYLASGTSASIDDVKEIQNYLNLWYK